MSRTLLAAAFCVAVFVLPAPAAPFTTQLDDLQAAVEQRQEALPDKLSKSEKKAAKAYKTVLKKLSKDSVSLGGDLKITKAVIKLEKLGDDGLNGLLDTSIAGLGSSMQTRVDTLQLRLDNGLAAAKSKVTPEKAQKAITQASERIAAAAGQEKRKKRVALLLQADASAKKGEKLLDKLGFVDSDPGDPGGGGGGGGGVCGGTAFGEGEAGGGVVGGSQQWTGEEYLLDTTGPQFAVTIFDCDGFGGRQFTIVLPATLALGDYVADATGASLTVAPLGENAAPITTGMVTINRADTQLTVTYLFDDGTMYQGGFSIPLPQ